ncbi:hypothetical protein P879_09481 [Paragonimus westermani]|uniref:Uncharacterized protein n=1 Tax=Paragonimus westermani TaxID=34504 RepID=A0A8T0D655_9TREM|nr:hypothetical protein P879_09481 [Paragonimus westermani]
MHSAFHALSFVSYLSVIAGGSSSVTLSSVARCKTDLRECAEILQKEDIKSILAEKITYCRKLLNQCSKYVDEETATN